MRFNKTIKLLEQEIFKPQPKEDREKNKEKYKELKVQPLIDEILSRATKNVDGSYDIDSDVDLSDMGLTKIPVKFNKVNGNFYCYFNKLTSLENAPNEISGAFWCYNNQLTTLEGAPKKVGSNFWCYNNKLTSLEGAPKEVGRSFWCYHNDKKFTEEEVREVCDVKGVIVV